MSPRARANNGPAERPVAAGGRVQLRRGGDRRDDSGWDIVGGRIGRTCWEPGPEGRSRCWLEAREVVSVLTYSAADRHDVEVRVTAEAVQLNSRSRRARGSS